MMNAKVKRYYIIVRKRIESAADLEKKEISIEFPLPPMLARLGNERLKGIAKAIK